ncbi:MAG: aminoacyl-tRNA hydrolase [Vicinamibacterales bacterium]|nr:aminoacyl-tRNA hydrolase [Vicinamibacterales bacterium]
MKLIVGLGNPGSEYSGTRHNIGFEVVDEVARRWGVTFQSAPTDGVFARSHGLPGGPPAAILLKPLTFMNRSGQAVGGTQRYYRVELSDLLVVTEDVNLPLGRLRARRQGSAGGHNGLRSVIESLGTHTFSRLRIGVGRGDPRRGLAGRVLSRFDAEERPAMNDSVGRAADAVEVFTELGVESVMNRFNRAETDATDVDQGDS